MVGQIFAPRLLVAEDPPPVEILNHNGTSDVLLCCEHAGQAIPSSLKDLGLLPEELQRHIAWDIGAEAVARSLSRGMDAPLLLQRYSRLVVDCNRPYSAPDCFPEVSDGTTIPGNCHLTDGSRKARFDAIHVPFHKTLSELITQRQEEKRAVFLVAIHSFTSRLSVGGNHRPWEIGLLSNRDPRLAETLMNVLRLERPHIAAAYNEPYAVNDESDYTIPVHGERRRIPSVLVEIRNDLITGSAQQDEWANLLAKSLRRSVAAFDQEGF